MSDPVRVIVNPSAGSGAAGRLAPRLRAALDARGTRYEMQVTVAPGHAVDLAREAATGGTPVVMAVGGDGTVHEVANGLLAVDDPPALAVLPVGTGNDFHRMVGTGRSVDAAVELLENGWTDRFEVGRARWPGGERHFVNVLGVGIDTEVIRRREAFRRLRGLAQYLAALLSAVARYRPLALDVRCEPHLSLAGRTMLTVVTVGPTVGGGFRVSPEASPHDGLLDLLSVDELGLGRTLRYLPRVVRGTHADLPVVRMHRLTRAHLASPSGDPFHFELDGEVMSEPVSGIDVTVDPARLPVLRPAGAS